MQKHLYLIPKNSGNETEKSGLMAEISSVRQHLPGSRNNECIRGVIPEPVIPEPVIPEPVIP